MLWYLIISSSFITCSNVQCTHIIYDHIWIYYMSLMYYIYIDQCRHTYQLVKNLYIINILNIKPHYDMVIKIISRALSMDQQRVRGI